MKLFKSLNLQVLNTGVNAPQMEAPIRSQDRTYPSSLKKNATFDFRKTPITYLRVPKEKLLPT